MLSRTLDSQQPVATPMVVNCVAYDHDGRSARTITLDQISEVIATSKAFVWVGLYEYASKPESTSAMCMTT